MHCKLVALLHLRFGLSHLENKAVGRLLISVPTLYIVKGLHRSYPYDTAPL